MNYTPPTSPSQQRRCTVQRRSTSMKESLNSELEPTDTNSAFEDVDYTINDLLHAIEIEKKLEVSRKEIEAAKGLNMEQKKVLVGWELMLQKKEEMLYQRERDIVTMFKLREDNLKHRENAVGYKDVMISNKRVRMDIVKKSKAIIATFQQK